MKSDFQGLIVPILTPVDEKGNLDEVHFVKLVRNLIARGVNGLYVAGTTGEAAQLRDSTWEAVNRVALREAAGTDTKVYCGAVFSATLDVIDHIHRLEEMSAEYAFVTPPFYTQDYSQESILKHYRRIIDETSIKLVIYHIELTTHQRIAPATTYAISQMSDRVVGIKDTNFDWPTHYEMLKLLEHTQVGVAAVPESAMAASLLLGANGVVTGLGNYLPEIYLDVIEAARRNDPEAAYAAQDKIMELDRVMRSPGGNSIARMKYLGAKLGLCEPYCSMSTADLSEQNKADMDRAYDYIVSQMKAIGAPFVE